MCPRIYRLLMTVLVIVASTSAFAPHYYHSSSRRPSSSRVAVPRIQQQQQQQQLQESTRGNNDVTDIESSSFSCWSPRLRILMGSIASLGVLETAFLTYSKLFEQRSSNNNLVESLCSLDGDCGSVLNGPYAVLPATNIPLAALGFLAYLTVTVLALQPLIVMFLSSSSRLQDEDNNRIWLAAISTGMGVFSVFLMSLLFGVLHETCLFCVASAILSIALAQLSWTTTLVPKQRTKDAAVSSFGTSVTALAAACLLFFANEPASQAATTTDGVLGQASMLGDSSSIVSTSNINSNTPPTITTVSSSRALQLASQLQSLDAHFYGAYWCSHCFDQKQTLGKQAMAKIPYVECSREGQDSQSQLCKDKQVPGYPTWEIQGKLYPGEQSLEELEDLVTSIQTGSSLVQ